MSKLIPSICNLRFVFKHLGQNVTFSCLATTTKLRDHLAYNIRIQNIVIGHTLVNTDF